MDDLSGRTVLLTGATGGLGRGLARALAGRGARVALSGRRERELGRLATDLAGLGIEAVAVAGDLAEPEAVDSLQERVESALGPIDVLVNNAGIESVGSFSLQSESELREMIQVNLTAPMLLARAVLPGMLARGRGHIVFVASLAGKIGPAYNAPYAATKAGLIGMTQSLRAELAGRPVGLSVICPGFIAGEGMYQRMVDDDGAASNRLMGETTVEKVAADTIEAIRKDRPIVIESGTPIRPMLALSELAPRTAERLISRFGLTRMFRRSAAARGRLDD